MYEQYIPLNYSLRVCSGFSLIDWQSEVFDLDFILTIQCIYIQYIGIWVRYPWTLRQQALLLSTLTMAFVSVEARELVE